MAIFVQINAMARQNDMGREGESEARAYLVKHGYNVLHTNWHWHHYELDIIAVKEDELIVVEVVPTLIIFKDGEVKWRAAGVHTAADLEEKLKEMA